MASVVQLTHMLMTHGGVMKAKVVDELTLLASIMAASVHDFGHGGVNNDFLNRYSRLFSTLCCAALAFAVLSFHFISYSPGCRARCDSSDWLESTAAHQWCCAGTAVCDLYMVGS